MQNELKKHEWRSNSFKYTSKILKCQTSFPVCFHKETARGDKNCKSAQRELCWSHCSPDTEPCAGASVLENSSGFPCAGSGKVRQRAVKADKMAAWWWLLLSPVRTPAQLGEAQKTNSNSCLPHWNSHLAQVSSKACHKNAVLWRTSPATPKIYRANLECMHWTAARLIE